jgi:hypothetical protein
MLRFLLPLWVFGIATFGRWWSCWLMVLVLVRGMWWWWPLLLFLDGKKGQRMPEEGG